MSLTYIVSKILSLVNKILRGHVTITHLFQASSIMPMLVLILVNLCTKFEMPSFITHTKDMTGMRKFTNGSHDPDHVTMHTWGLFCYAKANTCYDLPKYKI